MDIAFAFLTGLFSGGVLNTLADRLPPLDRRYDGPFISDRPRKLAWWEWLPLGSFAGAMRSRRMVIANNRLRYPMLEIATGALFAFTWARYGAEPWQAGAACAFGALFVTLAVIDLETTYLPYRLSVPTLAGALAVSPFWPVPAFAGMTAGARGWWEGFAAAGGAFAFFYGIHLLGVRLGRPLMGDGDAFVAAALGALLGFELLIVGLYFTAVLGGLFAFAVLAGRSFGYRARVIPYGPYIVAGGLVSLYFGHAIVTWSMTRL
jgi:leader peptidase (prepilin peptidase)/N-methyltransferase